jgi:hypothetical protein
MTASRPVTVPTGEREVMVETDRVIPLAEARGAFGG